MENQLTFSSWKKLLQSYQKSTNGRSIWQLVNSLVPYLALWYLMYRSLAVSYWLTLPLAVLAAGFLVRIFIISHDCGHASFFKSDRANSIVGTITSFLVFVPYHHWRWQHALHHMTAGDLDRRGLGDVWTLTVREYLNAPLSTRIAYRITRNPFVMFVLAPALLFLIKERFPDSGAKGRERHSVHWTNLATVLWITAMSFVFGFKAYLLIQVSVLAIAGSAGVWLFYVQHQFDGVYWDRHSEWNLVAAGLDGSSFYKLPPVLRWFTGNIGFHHIHHLNPQIPNYNLPRCQKSVAELQTVRPLTIWRSLKSFNYRLWDEGQQKLVSFRSLRGLRRQSGA